MELSGSHLFPAPQATVWAILTDPDTLQRSLPNCKQFDLLPDGGHAVTMNIGVAAIKGTYQGTVHMEDVVPPDSYTLRVTGQGPAGFVRGHGAFTLTPHGPEGAQTRLHFTGQAQVGGKIAGVGQRLLQAGAQMIAGQFFRALEKEVATHRGGTASTTNTPDG